MKRVSLLCAECNACIETCKHNAITFIEDKEGFSYPYINEKLCVNCHLCEQVCPMQNASKILYEKNTAIAAQALDSKILKNSSSGAIFPLIAQYILEKKGIVYGASWDKDLQLRHIGIDNIKDLPLLKGSKYVHSQIKFVYQEIKEYLRQNRFVYFTGTPCQVGGLRLFLRHDYPNLITSDIVCHGTPSQKGFNKIIFEIEKEKKGKITSYKFRDKQVLGWNCGSSSFYINNQKIIYNKNMKAYFRAFIKGDITRMDCYQCPFSCIKRVGDITLADYWDIDKQHPNFPNYQKGVSLILINTNKGNSIWEHIQRQTVHTQSSIEKILQTCNTNLKYPTPLSKSRIESYYKLLHKYNEFIDSYIDKKDKTNFYKTYYKQKLKQYFIFKYLFNIIGK